VKDLRILENRNLNEIVLVDNAAYSYFYQLENGIPIIPYYKGKKDS
jgi:CTD small phosphatase-like protein 2